MTDDENREKLTKNAPGKNSAVDDAMDAVNGLPDHDDPLADLDSSDPLSGLTGGLEEKLLKAISRALANSGMEGVAKPRAISKETLVMPRGRKSIMAGLGAMPGSDGPMSEDRMQSNPEDGGYSEEPEDMEKMQSEPDEEEEQQSLPPQVQQMMARFARR